MVLQDVVKSLHQINVRRAAPVVVDGVSQSLSVASRSSGVQKNDNKSSAGKDVRIPASAPVIVKGTLGTTVDNEGERVLLGGVKVDGLQKPAVDINILVALEPDILRGGKVDVGQSLGVEVGAASNGLGLDVDRVEVVGSLQGGGREEQSVVVDKAQSALRVLADNSLNSLSGEVDLEDLDVALVLSSDVDVLVLAVKENAAGAAVPTVGNNAGLAVGVDNNAVAVGLVLRLEHLEVGNGLAGGRVHGVAGSTDGGRVDVLGCDAASGGNGVDVGGGLPGIVGGVDLGDKDELLAVGRDVKVARVAKGNDRALEAGVEEQVDGLASKRELVAVLLDGGDKDVVLLLLNELVPVADHERIKGQGSILLVLLLLLILLLGTGKGSVGVDSGAKGDQAGGTVVLDVSDADGVGRESVGLDRSIHTLDKELLLGQEGDMVIVEEEGVVVGVVRDLGGEVGESVVVGKVDEVQVADGLVGVNVVARGGEDGKTSTGREHGGGWASEGQHALRGERGGIGDGGNHEDGG